jgi:hypothetical protein
MIIIGFDENPKKNNPLLKKNRFENKKHSYKIVSSSLEKILE